MATRHNLKHSILNILRHNRDGSCGTQAARRKRLILAANQLVDDGYQINHIRFLKAKHVQHLVDRWLNEGLSAGTLKNRLSDLRWIAEKLGRTDLVPSSNDTLNIPRRKFVSDQDKSITLSQDDLNKIKDPDVNLSLLLQREFGVRREESIKIQIHKAIVGSMLKIHGSWAKNGRPRSIPIKSPSQWRVLQQVQDHIGERINRALIPEDKSYVQQLKKYENELSDAGINKAHGLRHAYAQRRYHELTGWHCPVKGGPKESKLTSKQQAIDHWARQQISEEMGHSRLSILRVYCN